MKRLRIIGQEEERAAARVQSCATAYACLTPPLANLHTLQLGCIPLYNPTNDPAASCGRCCKIVSFRHFFPLKSVWEHSTHAFKQHMERALSSVAPPCPPPSSTGLLCILRRTPFGAHRPSGLPLIEVAAGILHPIVETDGRLEGTKQNEFAAGSATRATPATS